MNFLWALDIIIIMWKAQVLCARPSHEKWKRLVEFSFSIRVAQYSSRVDNKVGI